MGMEGGQFCQPPDVGGGEEGEWLSVSVCVYMGRRSMHV